MTKCNLGLQLSVWIMQVSLFVSVHTRFHCIFNILAKPKKSALFHINNDDLVFINKILALLYVILFDCENMTV